MNDAHIYCTPEQLKDELKATVEITLNYYKRFRFQNVKVRISTHDPKNTEKFLPHPELWAHSEKVVTEVVTEMGLEHFVGVGEAAFYGPKIDFQATTGLGREESISTTQLDFGGPLRFDLNYVGEDGKLHRPYIVHRAPLSTHERFFAFLIEHLGGAFPTWMSPIQAMIIPVNDSVLAHCKDLQQKLRSELFRCEIDTDDDSFNKKIRNAVTRKIPNIVIVGNKEAESGNVTLRRYCVKEQITLPQQSFIERMQRLRKERIMDNFPDVEV
jgi:threonyl-tRNA synthetase